MPNSPEQVVSEVGKHLAQPRLGKDALVKLLKQAESALSELSQSSSLHDGSKWLKYLVENSVPKRSATESLFILLFFS